MILSLLGNYKIEKFINLFLNTKDMGKMLNRTALGISILLSGCSAVIETSESPLEKKISEELVIKMPENIPEKKISEELIPPAPRYNYPEKYCAAYAISVARDHFNKNYPYSDAWNLRYKSGEIQELSGNEEFEKLAKKGLIEKGTILGTYFSNSTHLNERDETGEKVQYTHLMVYVGVEKEPVFYHQFIDTEETIRLSQLGDSLTIKEIINEKEF